MDLTKHYRNKKLEARRKQRLKVEQAEQAARKRRQADRAVARLVPAVQPDIDTLPAGRAEADRRLLAVVYARSAIHRDDDLHASVEHLANHWEQWIDCPETWHARTHNRRRQLMSLIRHLLCRYDVSACLDEAWLGGEEQERFRAWFIHIGSGQSLRVRTDLPFPFTKRIAHLFVTAPPGLGACEAVRRAQVISLGGDERLARTIIGTHLGRRFDPPEAEAFWETVIRWLVRYPMIEAQQVGPLIDYLHDQRFVDEGAVIVDGKVVHRGPPQPTLTMKDRQPQALLREVTRWHARLNRGADEPLNLRWQPSIRGYERIEGVAPNQRVFRLVQLLSSRELKAEGRAMCHCVYSYARSCATGRTAIYSLQVNAGTGWQRRATVEVDVQTRRVVQVRGRFNAPIDGVEKRIVAAWMTAASLIAGRFMW